MADEADARERSMCMAWSTLKERVFVNYRLPFRTRFEVYGATVLSAGLYASAVSHYTDKEVAQLDARHFGFLKQMVQGVSYRSSREEVIVKAAEAGVCIIPLEIMIQQAQLRFAAHVERYVHVDEIEPFLPRGIAHLSLRSQGRRSGALRMGPFGRQLHTPLATAKV